jgi:drug/metabolite transporter (DMT)-like permease
VLALHFQILDQHGCEIGRRCHEPLGVPNRCGIAKLVPTPYSFYVPTPLSTDSVGKVWAAFWGAALFWGTSFVWIKVGLEQWDPVSLVAFRLLVASTWFGAVLFITRTPIKIPRDRWWVFLLVALMNPFLPFLLISWAEVRIETGVTSILNATVPLFTLIFAPLFLPDEKPTWRTLVGTSVGFLGIAILFSGQVKGDFLHSSEGLIGQLAVLVACFLYSISAVILRRYGPKTSPLVQAALLNGLACVFVWMQAVTTGALTLPPAQINWLAVIWLGSFGSFGAYSLGMYVMHKRGATQLALINFAYPLLGMFLGILFLGESFSPRLLLGGMLILGGIALVQVSKPRTKSS